MMAEHKERKKIISKGKHIKKIRWRIILTQEKNSDTEREGKI